MLKATKPHRKVKEWTRCQQALSPKMESHISNSFKSAYQARPTCCNVPKHELAGSQSAQDKPGSNQDVAALPVVPATWCNHQLPLDTLCNTTAMSLRPVWLDCSMHNRLAPYCSWTSASNRFQSKQLQLPQRRCPQPRRTQPRLQSDRRIFTSAWLDRSGFPPWLRDGTSTYLKSFLKSLAARGACRVCRRAALVHGGRRAMDRAGEALLPSASFASSRRRCHPPNGLVGIPPLLQLLRRHELGQLLFIRLHSEHDAAA